MNNRSTSKRMILAVDPGKLSGVAWYRNGQFGSNEVTDPLALCDAHPWSEIVVERYDITANTARLTRQYEALDILGALGQFAKEHEIKLVKQQRAVRKRTSDAMLKRLGLWNPTKDGHANDAAKHLVTYMVKWSLLSDEEVRKLTGR